MQMVVLVASIITVGILCLTDLLLAFGVIRSPREHVTTLGGPRSGQRSVIGLAVGDALGAAPDFRLGSRLLLREKGLRREGELA
jgi:hypothetical protein